MHSTVLGCFGLLLVLGSLSCLEAAPPKEKEAAKVEQLVRVYPINEEQYERLLKLTDGKNVISEARLTSAGFTSVRNTLDSSWHSLLRIIGLTRTTSSEDVKIDIDGQPLCVMQRTLGDDGKLNESEPRALEAKAATEDDSVINCIVVLKRDPAVQAPNTYNPDFAPYWYHEENKPKEEEQQQEQQQQQKQDAPVDTLQMEAETAEEQKKEQNEEQHEERKNATTTVAPKLTKTKKKKRNKSKSKSRSKQSTQKSSGRKSVAAASDVAASRQYGSPYAPPTPPGPYGSSYGSPYGSPYGGSYGGYSPYSPYNPYAPPYGQQPPFAPQPPFGPPPPFGPQPPFGQQPYYPLQYYGQPPPYNPYPYYEQAVQEEDDDDDDDDDNDEFAANLEAEVAVNSPYDNDYYD